MRRLSVDRVAVGLMLAGLLASCRGKDADDEAAGADRAVGVRTAVAVLGSVPDIVTAIGSVTPRPGHFADISAPAATRVAKVHVALGQRVQAGDVLVEFEQAPFAAAARSADAAQTAAQATYDRAQRLAQAGVIPRKELDQATADLAAAQSLAVTARRSLELATLRAPIAGMVTRMDAVLSQPVDANQALIQVVDQDALDIVFGVAPDAAAGVHAGQEVTLRAAEASSGNVLGTGRVTSVSGAVDSLSRAVPVRVQLVRPARPLRVGETLVGQIAVGMHRGVVTIPAEALVPAGEALRVFVVVQGLARARDVTVGARADSLVEIRQGVAAGDTVVTYGVYGLADSVKVVRAARP